MRLVQQPAVAQRQIERQAKYHDQADADRDVLVDERLHRRRIRRTRLVDQARQRRHQDSQPAEDQAETAELDPPFSFQEESEDNQRHPGQTEGDRKMHEARVQGETTRLIVRRSWP